MAAMLVPSQPVPCSPPSFHDGQLRMQQLCGTQKIAASIEPYLTSAIDSGLVEPLHDASVVYVAYQTGDGLTWLSVVVRPASSTVPLVHVLASHRVRVTGEVSASDPLRDALSVSGGLIGLTVMQEWTRDRFRLMGRLAPSTLPTAAAAVASGLQGPAAAVSTVSFEFDTTLCMALCPKYIVDRRIVSRRARSASEPPIRAAESRSAIAPLPLPPAALELLARTDTFWLGTTEPGWGSQSSHRGGLPGLLRVSVQPGSTLPRLQWGDYKGNNMFHSLGAALDNPLAALLVVDYQLGHCLQLAGTLTTLFASQPGTDLDGASRRVQLDVLQWRWTTAIVPFVYRTASYSYHSPAVRKPRTSDEVIRAVPAGPQLLDLELAAIVRDAVGIATFRLKPADGSQAALPQWLPAQYATLRLLIDGVEHERSWTITSLSSVEQRGYTLDVTVKRTEGGVVSTFLHDRAAAGLRFRLVGIEGSFSTPSMYWTESTEGVTAVHGRPLRKLWLSAGIGITPFLAHMRAYARFHSLHDRARLDVPRSDIVWLHMDQSMEHVPCLDEIAAFVHSSRSLRDAPLAVHFVLCLSRRSAAELRAGQGDAARFAAVFGSDTQDDQWGHMPLAQLVAGRGSALTLVHACRCPPTPPHEPVRCDDTLDCRNAVLLGDRGVDACGSVPVMAVFRSWTEQWKAMGINVRNFRTESFAY